MKDEIKFARGHLRSIQKTLKQFEVQANKYKGCGGVALLKRTIDRFNDSIVDAGAILRNVTEGKL